MTAVAALKQTIITVERANHDAPILYVSGKNEISIIAGTALIIDGKSHAIDSNAPFVIDEHAKSGKDYGLTLNGDRIVYSSIDNVQDPIGAGYFAGFHFAPGGCSHGVSGGGDTPAINPNSIWDIGFRPSCPDPRGMTLVDVGGRRVWVDIYLLGTDHGHGTSRPGSTIADGRDLPDLLDGKGKFRKLDYPTAVEIYNHHNKRLLTAEEFFAAAYGVKERCSRDNEPKVTGATGNDANRFISKWGIFDVTGTMSQWGTDGHPDDPRPSIFGGSWFNGSSAGSRYARLGYWPGNSSMSLSARGACDHLMPA